ncbi:ATR-interacting protein mus304-like isoform X1 [Drosophila grimshawi]|uniref:ATR-interacting protein mus304-like isoform X1 n=1 Tax=Drosophila grimshawi TaxID=7222 RepID=UPI001C933053|nr:ATR-interacting protein mus304-like isoform X1 [Drosophila grimshawi]
MERIDVLKKENEKLHRRLIESNNRAGGNEGEVSLLRNELRQARKLLQASKIEKFAIAEEGEKDCNKKVAEVFKLVTAKDAELNFTNVAFSDLKIRNANSNERSIFKNNDVIVTDADECRNLLRIEDLCIVSPSTNQFFTKPHYEYAKDAHAKKQRTFFEMELEQLLYYAKGFSERSTVETTTGRIIESVCRVFTEFWTYTQSLELPQNCMMYPYHRFDLQSDHRTYMRYSLIQPGALYNPEQAIPLRRYFGTLAQIYREQSSISHTLLQKKYGKYWVLQIVIEAITKISYSSEVFEHFGVLEATAALLHSFLGHMNPVVMSTSGPQLELLFDLLKHLVFTRPSPWVFRELSACMLLCSRYGWLMTGMCVNSPSNYFISDRVRSVYRFGSKSCLIQVYAGLIELCLCSELPLQPNHFKLLLAICSNHVRFVYSCFAATPQFVLRMLSFPSLTDEDKEENKNMPSNVGSLHSGVTLTNYNSASSVNASAINSANISKFSLIPVQDPVPHEVGCECYVKLCLSVVTIVFQMMFQWVIQDKKSDISQVGEISHIAVHLLTLIFREYYVSCLFRDSEQTTKHYLFLLCN